jgi:hypothetical protein
LGGQWAPRRSSSRRISSRRSARNVSRVNMTPLCDKSRRNHADGNALAQRQRPCTVGENLPGDVSVRLATRIVAFDLIGRDVNYSTADSRYRRSDLACGCPVACPSMRSEYVIGLLK